ncbi:MAG: hypothetical protein ABIP89_13770, partial [Polyangiaceae bacterium]
AFAGGAGVRGATSALARRFTVGRAQAERDIQALLASFGRSPRRRREKAPYTFREVGDGFELRAGRDRSLHVERASGRVLTHGRDPALLRLAAPHVLALHGHAVLHASAAHIGRKVVAFMGPSGVGKTTIARILNRAGASIISRDLVVMKNSRRALLAGESAIFRWSRRSARTIDANPLEDAWSGASAPAAAILVLERAAPDSGLRIDALGGATAIAALFANAFIELPDPRVWRSALAACEALAAGGLVRRARVPEGRAALRRALLAWLHAGARVTPRR